MKKILLFIPAIIILVSCYQPQVDLSQLDGYWEIKVVENAEGQSKSFTINETVDLIIVEENAGYRKKVKPLFSGKFEGSKDVEKFVIEQTDEQIWMLYTTAYDSWKEEILELTEEKLVIKNQYQVTYTYQRYKALSTYE